LSCSARTHPLSLSGWRTRRLLNVNLSIKELAMRIENLTPDQVDMLDFMWTELDTYEDMLEWMASLDPADRVQAENLQRLMLLEAAETLLEESEYHDANRVIDQFRLTK
jgi:hypothetical protein